MTRFVLAFALAFLLAAPAARADGDPASDVLLGEDVYYGYGIDLRAKAAAQLPAMLATSRERGYELKIAMISADFDLGTVAPLWRAPQKYARYLGSELSLVYRGVLLVVMPNGYGIYQNGTVPGRERRVIARLRPPRRTERFLSSALAAARALAAAGGVKLTVPDVEPAQEAVTPAAGHTAAPTATATPARETSPAAWLFLVPVGLFIAAGAVAAVLARRRETAARS